jgi:REP element-mobilizing transposase RayT
MVKFDPQKHHRHSIRLKGFDYASAGGYFVTVVTWHRECLFGQITNREMILSRYGEIVQKWWHEIPIHFSNVETGAFVIMPNHIHGIILIAGRRGTVPVPENKGRNKISHENDIPSEIRGRETPPLHTPTLGQIVAYFKYQSTKEMNGVDHTGTVTKFWQRNYYEHILRNDQDLQNKTEYIEANPLLWEKDDENPSRQE